MSAAAVPGEPLRSARSVVQAGQKGLAARTRKISLAGRELSPARADEHLDGQLCESQWVPCQGDLDQLVEMILYQRWGEHCDGNSRERSREHLHGELHG